MQSGNKPLSEPIMTQIHVAILHHWGPQWVDVPTYVPNCFKEIWMYICIINLASEVKVKRCRWEEFTYKEDKNIIKLTHWPLGKVALISNWYLVEISLAFHSKLPSKEYHKFSLVISNHWYNNGLMPSGNMPLPEPVSTKVFDATWRH